MKFGKDLEQYKHPEWEDEYMNYQMLKDILRKLESQTKVRLDCDCLAQRSFPPLHCRSLSRSQLRSPLSVPG